MLKEKMKEKVEEKKEYSIVKYIHYRIKSNKNFITSITGPTGSGKSWTALSIAELLDEDFNIDRVIFRAGDLMRLINSGTLEKGSVIIWDEAGIDLSNRNWQSAMNKVINFLLQTFRHRNFILIFTVPYSDFIDSASRKLFHGEFITCGVNKKKKTCTIKPKMLQYNSSMKKWYAKYIKMRKDGGKIIKIKRWKVPKPSEQLIKDYEEKKNEFTKILNNEIEDTLVESGMEKKDSYKIAYRHRDLYIAWHLKTRIQKDIAKMLGVTAGAISTMIQRMDKLYPEWRNDKNLLCDLNDLGTLSNLSPTQLKFLDSEKIIDKE